MKTTIVLAFVLLAIPCASAGTIDSFGTGANAFDIEFVYVGNRSNPDDTTGAPNPVGKVDYGYRMGKFEVSEDMINKANALGGLGITKDNRGLNKPATSISWFEAARFVNWLNTSTGHTPAYKFAIQPGEPGYNTFQEILLWDPADAGYDPNNLYRNSKARYFLPSVDEWYKAAYYDPDANSGSGGYWDYPTGSNGAPTAVASGTAAGTGVFGQSLPADITQAGGLSPYGTMAQGGNAWEWQETDSDLVNDLPTSSVRIDRGASYANNAVTSQSTIYLDLSPSDSPGQTGFRVASVPEPSSWLIAALASIVLLWRRRSQIAAPA